MPHALVVDDDLLNTEVLTMLLNAQGISVMALQDAAQVEAYVQQTPTIDLIFLDLEMPKINGYELLARLLKNLDHAIPIVACTVHTNEIEAAHEHGFHSFIGKPLDPARFPDQIQRILNGNRVWEG